MNNHLFAGLAVLVLVVGGYVVLQSTSSTQVVVNTTPDQQVRVDNLEEQAVNRSDDEGSEVRSSTFCEVDADCGLLICSGCFSNDFLQTAPPDLACRRYEGYRCECRDNTCTAVN